MGIINQMIKSCGSSAAVSVVGGSWRYWRILATSYDSRGTNTYKVAMRTFSLYANNLATGTDLALSKPAYCISYDATHTATLANDGNYSTDWERELSAATPPWWYVDLGSAQIVKSMLIQGWGSGGSSYMPTSWVIQVSSDATNWKTYTNITNLLNSQSVWTFDLSISPTAKLITAS